MIPVYSVLMSTKGIDATFFVVKDMKRARAFYDAVLGVKPNVVSEEHWVEYVLPDGATFALGYNPGGEFHPGFGVLLGVDNLDEATGRATAAGGNMTGLEMGGRICKSRECIDTEGNYLYLHERLTEG